MLDEEEKMVIEANNRLDEEKIEEENKKTFTK